MGRPPSWMMVQILLGLLILVILVLGVQASVCIVDKTSLQDTLNVNIAQNSQRLRIASIGIYPTAPIVETTKPELNLIPRSSSSSRSRSKTRSPSRSRSRSPLPSRHMKFMDYESHSVAVAPTRRKFPAYIITMNNSARVKALAHSIENMDAIAWSWETASTPADIVKGEGFDEDTADTALACLQSHVRAMAKFVRGHTGSADTDVETVALIVEDDACFREDAQDALLACAQWLEHAHDVYTTNADKADKPPDIVCVGYIPSTSTFLALPESAKVGLTNNTNMRSKQQLVCWPPIDGVNQCGAVAYLITLAGARRIAALLDAPSMQEARLRLRAAGLCLTLPLVTDFVFYEICERGILFPPIAVEAGRVSSLFKGREEKHLRWLWSAQAAGVVYFEHFRGWFSGRALPQLLQGGGALFVPQISDDKKTFSDTASLLRLYGVALGKLEDIGIGITSKRSLSLSLSSVKGTRRSLSAYTSSVSAVTRNYTKMFQAKTCKDYARQHILLARQALSQGWKAVLFVNACAPIVPPELTDWICRFVQSRQPLDDAVHKPLRGIIILSEQGSVDVQVQVEPQRARSRSGSADSPLLEPRVSDSDFDVGSEMPFPVPKDSTYLMTAAELILHSQKNDMFPTFLLLSTETIQEFLSAMIDSLH